MSIEFKFKSSDESTQLSAQMWEPDHDPVGIIQIIHGMAEHMGRYTEFAEHLASQGWVVVGDDHLGHGRTATAETLGFFGRNHPVEHLQQDEINLMRSMKRANPSLPYVMLGHSMGTMILQSMLRKISYEIDGVVLIGTSAPHPELLPAWPLIEALNRVAPRKVGKFLDGMAFGSFSKSFNKHVKFSWLTHDPTVLQQYEHDPKSGFIFTNNGFHTLFTLTRLATSKNWIENVRKQLPILILSGTHDPVGKFGVGPKYHFNLLNQAGFTHVTLQLFENMRHEILNETDRQNVFRLIDHWLANILTKEW